MNHCRLIDGVGVCDDHYGREDKDCEFFEASVRKYGFQFDYVVCKYARGERFQNYRPCTHPDMLIIMKMEEL